MEINQLLETLAQQLGTTAEYLWGVLLKQAPIDATITLVQIICVVLYGIALYKLNIYFSKYDDEDHGRNKYERSDTLCFAMILGASIFLVLAIISFCSIASVLNGYFNPEYWALKEILNSVNQ